MSNKVSTVVVYFLDETSHGRIGSQLISPPICTLEIYFLMFVLFVLHILQFCSLYFLDGTRHWRKGSQLISPPFCTLEILTFCTYVFLDVYFFCFAYFAIL